MHNFCKQFFLVDYTSTYCLLSIELSFEYTLTHQFRMFCVCMLLIPYFSLKTDTWNTSTLLSHKPEYNKPR